MLIEREDRISKGCLSESRYNEEKKEAKLLILVEADCEPNKKRKRKAIFKKICSCFIKKEASADSPQHNLVFMAGMLITL